jgi:hypothetical protein
MQYPFPNARQKAADRIKRTSAWSRYARLYEGNRVIRTASDAGRVWLCAQINGLISDGLVIGMLCNTGIAIRSGYGATTLLHNSHHAANLAQKGFELAAFSVCATATAGAMLGFALCTRGLCSHLYHNNFSPLKNAAKKGLGMAKALGARAKGFMRHNSGPKI